MNLESTIYIHGSFLSLTVAFIITTALLLLFANGDASYFNNYGSWPLGCQQLQPNHEYASTLRGTCVAIVCNTHDWNATPPDIDTLRRSRNVVDQQTRHAYCTTFNTCVYIHVYTQRAL